MQSIQSALLDERVAQGQEAIQEHNFSNASNRLLLFFGYVAATNARTRFLVYSRSAFTDSEVAAQWVKDWETRLPAMRGRLHTFSVPGDRQATFRDADTARACRGHHRLCGCVAVILSEPGRWDRVKRAVVQDAFSLPGDRLRHSPGPG